MPIAWGAHATTPERKGTHVTVYIHKGAPCTYYSNKKEFAELATK